MKNKGFTLAEMVAVIAVLMVLSLLSVPFVRGYIDDSYNGKALIFLRQLNEACLNFERDYPGTSVSGAVDFEVSGDDCDLRNIYGNTDLVVTPDILFKCKYLQVPTDLKGRYTFKAGSVATCSSCATGIRVSLLGGENAGAYKNKCACMDNIGDLKKEAV